MTTTQWHQIVEECEGALPKRFSEFYYSLLKDLAPHFKAKYKGVSTLAFEEIFEEKLSIILDRMVNGTLAVKNPRSYIRTAMTNFYRDELRKKQTNKHQSLAISVELEENQLPTYTLLNEAETSALYQEKQALEDQQIAIIKTYVQEMKDEVATAIIEGYLKGKKDSQIKKDLNYQKTNAAFSDKKKKLFKKIRLALFRNKGRRFEE